MGRYITSSEFSARYSQGDDYAKKNVESHFIYYAENHLDSLLGNYFTVPFSSDNLTAKDLAMELTYIRISDLKFEDREAREKHFMEWIDRITSGKMQMIVSSGTLPTIGDTVFSSTANYHPTFGMGDIENYLVDSSQVYNEFTERHP